MIVKIGKRRYSISVPRKRKSLGKYLVSVKDLDMPLPGYRDLFYAATKKVALRQIRLLNG